ncbi:hypothetical protein [Ostreiculturibacter nitratireducens]|uniref:hypothetical protein n=1 Tax=Ostreiculturibacter nitratireducens TaxID=3075226 RepID=UPI0031B5F90A
MKRRTFIGLAGAALLFATPVFGQGVVDSVVTQLREQGYTSITIGRTLLGRTRIVALSDRYRREIIINPRTGEILRDFWQVLGAGQETGGGARLIDPSEMGDDDDDGVGGSRDDDHDDDDDSDDDDSDDSDDDGGDDDGSDDD